MHFQPLYIRFTNYTQVTSHSQLSGAIPAQWGLGIIAAVVSVNICPEPSNMAENKH
jgi:hypothetical protein